MSNKNKLKDEEGSKCTDLLGMSYPLTDRNEIEVRSHLMYVDKKPFVVDHPDEMMESFEDGKLITLFRGHLRNEWPINEIKGYFA